MPFGRPPHVAKHIIIALDFDGTVAIGERAKAAAAKRIYGIDLRPRQMTRSTFPLGPESYVAMMRLVTTEMIMDFSLAPGCAMVLHSLHRQGFRFAVVTSRSSRELEPCKRFVRHHGLPVRYFHSTDDSPKDYVCGRLHARAIIDDSLAKLLPLAGSGLELFFLRQPWNRHERLPLLAPKNLHQIRSWTEFGRRLIALKALHEAVCWRLGWENSWRRADDIAAYVREHPAEAQAMAKDYQKAA
ncbi:hypothetical protein JXB02_00065 [Candidatus Woesearchaeota archaeon]|nr:hypothetical protein [Candidatus Woesearchaeota archaeon]